MSLNVSIGMTFSSPVEKTLYRVPHDIERINSSDRPTGQREDLRYRTDGSRGRPRQVVINAGDAMPEVYRLDPFIHVILDCGWQRLWRELNPMLSVRKWSTLLGNALAWTNNTGFPGKYNCLTGEDEDRPLPRFDQQRTCGGAVLTGEEIGGLLYIESMRVNDPVPTAEEVLKNPSWWYWGTSVSPDGSVQVIPRLGIDGRYHWVRVPNVTATQTSLPLNELHKLPAGSRVPLPTWLP